MSDLTNRLIELVSLSKTYCEECRESFQYNKEDFIDHMLDILPRIYWNFFDISGGVSLEENDFFPEYVDEAVYDQIKSGIAALMGEDDTFLETFEEDMKYSETPINASISESLADLYQPLFNFVSVVYDSDGTQIEEAFINCKEAFENYWSQTLCNVLRALNGLKYNNYFK